MRRVVAAAVAAGRDVVLVVHSYGGLPAAEAVRGLGEKERVDGGGAVVRLVYVCAFFGDVGFYLLQPLGDQPLPWFRVEVSAVCLGEGGGEGRWRGAGAASAPASIRSSAATPSSSYLDGASLVRAAGMQC